MIKANKNYHYSVLLNQAVEGLNIRPNGNYIDGTYGRGGHSELILKKLSDQGKLLVFDKDQVAINFAQELYGNDPRVSIFHKSFTEVVSVVKQMQLEHKIDGLLLDLGVSSPQLNDENRGFSFLKDGPLDMRMNQTSGVSAAEWLSNADEQEMISVLKNYGEEKFAKRIAREIISFRSNEPILSTLQLVSVIEKALPFKEKNKHPATRTFQAIRIHINQELSDLEKVLEDSIKILSPKARIVAISFHSLEDRIVKRFMRDQQNGPSFPKQLPIQYKKNSGSLKIIGKTIRPSNQDIKINPRARSAIMRIAEVTA